MKDIYHITPDEVAKGALMPYRIVETEEKMYEEMGRIMADCIEKNNGDQTVIILPVGPIGQYKHLAREINERRLSLKNCYFINMDEYLDENDHPIAKNDPLSFHGIMERVLYSQIDPELIMPENQRLFPEPGHENEIDSLIDSFGKVDCCLTGVGINGHIAFNEPALPEEDITDEKFGNIGTRCLDISRETIVNNGANKLRGALDIFPRRCITLGMRQLMKAETFKVYLYCPWQWGIMRKCLLTEPTRFAPVTYLQRHGNAEVVVTPELFGWML